MPPLLPPLLLPPLLIPPLPGGGGRGPGPMTGGGATLLGTTW